MLSAGHPHAARYPIWMVWCEAQVVSERLNNMEATRAVLLQMAISTIPNQAMKPQGQKKAVREFNKLIGRLTGS